ncbi:MAG: error-prone DNA polymerase, partial [Rhodospirillales bacterium]|nr:error-prone DNA polymerase [Rhodospirillales bacterium]
EYGFPESHAASFALLVYASAWVKCHYPDVFATSLLNAQPMGFYAPAEIVRDAEEHGVEARPPDINHSAWDNALEEAPTQGRLHARHAGQRADLRTTQALRLGFRQIDGLREDDMQRLVAARGRGYDSVRDLWLRGGLAPATIEALAEADAFRSLGLDRRDALWAARGLNRVGGQEDLPLFAEQPADPTREADFALPAMPLGEQVVEDYRTLRLSLKTHPLALLRGELDRRKVIPSERLESVKDGARVRVAGLVLVRQRPGTASGVIFMTLQDETHVANVVVWPRVFEMFRAEVLGARLCGVEGKVQSESGVIHVIADRIEDLSPLLARLSAEPFVNPLTPADEARRPPAPDIRGHPRNLRHDLSYAEAAARAMPKGRNFQ